MLLFAIDTTCLWFEFIIYSFCHVLVVVLVF